MNLTRIAETLSLENLTPELTDVNLNEISGGYCSDLLSDVLAHAPHGGILVTIQVHMNVIAVAVHSELSAVIFASGRAPDNEVVKMAVKEGIRLYKSPKCGFDIAGELYALGLRGGL